MLLPDDSACFCWQHGRGYVLALVLGGRWMGSRGISLEAVHDDSAVLHVQSTNNDHK